MLCKKLLEALPGLLGGVSLCPSEEMQVLGELRPCFGNSNQETYAFDSMMQEARSKDAVEHVHQVLEEHLDAPAAQGPAISMSSSKVLVVLLYYLSLFTCIYIYVVPISQRRARR